jgi:chromate transporter
MNAVVVYLLLLKATITTFSGLAGLPMVRQDFVVSRHVITDAQLNAAVAVGQAVPGPNGLWVVCVGHQAAGLPGAIAGSLAMVTPAFLAAALLLWVGRHAGHPVVRSVVSAVLLAGAALLIVITVQLARTAITDPFSAAVAAASFGILAFTGLDTVWIMLAAAAAGLVRNLAAR